MLTLSPTSSLHELLEEYPFLVEILAGFNPRFGLLHNPFMRRSVARFATLERVADIGSVPLDELLGTIREAVEARTGTPVNVALAPDASSTQASGTNPDGRGWDGQENGPTDRAREKIEQSGQDGEWTGRTPERAPQRQEREETGPSRGSGELKKLIRELHAGLPPEEARVRFDALVQDVAPDEIAAMEEELIREGMPVQEIQRLCDLHVATVRTVLDRADEVKSPAGHPVHTAMAENRVISDLANRLGELAQEWDAVSSPDLPPSADDAGSSHDPSTSTHGAGPHDRMSAHGNRAELRRTTVATIDELAGIESHYVRKENQLFPFLERHGITGPPKVMWGVHDEIRGQLKAVRAALHREEGEGPGEGDGSGSEETHGPLSTTAAAVAEGARRLARSLTEMVYKENKILFPMALQTLTRDEWAQVRAGDDQLGYAFAEPEADFPGPGISLPVAGTAGSAVPGHASSDPAGRFDPRSSDRRESGAAGNAPTDPAGLPPDGLLDLGTGRLSVEQLDMLLRHLPVDLSFVDASGHVRYYSETEERIFPRSPAAIGRHVENCHPPKSVAMVKEILRAFEAGEQDQAEFWIDMNGRFIHIRYFAVRNASGEFLGTLEVTQDATRIRALEGERRLLEWNQVSPASASRGAS